MNFNKVVFYNYWHRGDLHFSRSFVKKISEICLSKDIECLYFYNDTDPTILNDINVKYVGLMPGCDNGSDRILDNILYLNTWYGSRPQILNDQKTTFNCLYSLFSYYFPYFGVKITDFSPLDFFPNIDYSKYYIENVDIFFRNNLGKRFVLISNGPVLSCQSNNTINFNEIVSNLAKKFTGVIFLLTNKDCQLNFPNVLYTGDIINKDKKFSDINETSYISTFCDTIVGRSSGPYSFSMTKDNMFKTGKNFICFCYSYNAYDNLAYWRPRNDTLLPPYTCRITQQIPHDNSSIYNTIEHIINFPS